jgi:hypothetical protein
VRAGGHERRGALLADALAQTVVEVVHLVGTDGGPAPATPTVPVRSIDRTGFLVTNAYVAAVQCRSDRARLNIEDFLKG